MVYYSARLLFVILVENGKAKKKNHYDESVIVFKAHDFSHAFERALELGKKREKIYKNSKEQNVRWALVQIVNLDIVGRKIDGMEVSSKLYHCVSAEPISADQLFYPELSVPNQSF
ncbi:MAG: DUF4288 domain-containing protein [Acidobacteria bacterium]|nr:DUF4288 domain-containing protein [Acidobacteriota bacterium]